MINILTYGSLRPGGSWYIDLAKGMCLKGVRAHEPFKIKGYNLYFQEDPEEPGEIMNYCSCLNSDNENDEIKVSLVQIPDEIYNSKIKPIIDNSYFQEVEIPIYFKDELFFAKIFIDSRQNISKKFLIKSGDFLNEYNIRKAEKKSKENFAETSA